MILILGYTMHIFITASSHHVACKIAVIGSLFIGQFLVGTLLKMLEIAYLSFKKLIQNFLGGMPPHPSRQLAPSVLDSVVSES
jgi:hypothetical protein